MSTYPRAVWNQLKNKTVQDFARALKRDGWTEEIRRGATVGYRHATRDPNHNRVVLHMHPKGAKGPKIIKGLLDTIGWNEDDLVRLGLIKRRGGKDHTDK